MHFSWILAAVKNGRSKNRQALVNVNGITCIFSTIVGLVRVRLIRALILQSEVRWASTEKVHCFFLLYTCLNFTKKNQYKVCWVNFPGGWSYFGQWYWGTIIDFSVIEVSGFNDRELLPWLHLISQKCSHFVGKKKITQNFSHFGLSLSYWCTVCVSNLQADSSLASLVYFQRIHTWAIFMIDSLLGISIITM